VAGDSVGGSMTAAITIMAKQRGGPHIACQLLYYPVTDAAFETGSYHQFATGYWLRRDAMQWFWAQYTSDPAQRAEITASPLRATAGDLAGLPPALVINGELTCCGTRARPTPRTCARPTSRPPRSVATAPSTTSSCSTRCANPRRPGRHRPGR